MAKELDLKFITHITTDAIGAPGKRVFYLQAHQDTRTITLIVEKFQVQSMAVAVEQFMAELQQRYPDLSEASADYTEENMRIHPPIDPLFRAGELALGYDEAGDQVILIARELLPDLLTSEPEEEEAQKEAQQVVRFWCTRSQLRAMAHWGMEIVSRGRPLCPQCSAPIDPEEGHFCAKKNGHRG